MLTIYELLQKYNIPSSKYGPNLYQNNNLYGICLDLKDHTFSYLTRIFTFKDLNAFEDFLKLYTWYKKNAKKYNITLSLNNYERKDPIIKYFYNTEEITLNNISDSKFIYLYNIKELTNYLNNLLNTNYQLQLEKNTLKIKENDLKQ